MPKRELRGRGWHGERGRHSEAAKRGHMGRGKLFVGPVGHWANESERKDAEKRFKELWKELEEMGRKEEMTRAERIKYDKMREEAWELFNRLSFDHW